MSTRARWPPLFPGEVTQALGYQRQASSFTEDTSICARAGSHPGLADRGRRSPGRSRSSCPPSGPSSAPERTGWCRPSTDRARRGSCLGGGSAHAQPCPTKFALENAVSMARHRAVAHLPTLRWRCDAAGGAPGEDDRGPATEHAADCVARSSPVAPSVGTTQPGESACPSRSRPSVAAASWPEPGQELQPCGRLPQ